MSRTRNSVLRFLIVAAGLAAACGGPTGTARAQSPTFSAPSQGNLADKVGIDQKLNQQVPLDVTFKDETGREVKLGEYFGKRPVILMMPFYRCAGTCVLETEGMIKVANAVNPSIGKDYSVVIVSLDPRETPD